MEISIPKEVLLLHRLCAKATEEGTPGMARMRLFFNKAEGRAQVSNGKIACEVTWSDPEYGLDGEAQVTLLGHEAKYLEKMATDAPVFYNHEEQTFNCGGFALPATPPRQKEFAFLDEALDGALKGLKPKAVTGMQFALKDIKTLVDIASKLGLDVPFVFYGDKRPVCLEMEKAEIAYRFLMVPRTN